ncbi:MAG: fliE [Bacteriovoracaceae bacterium]|nr:fliE [Bacteriovoracaceae bacterium]
MKITGLPSFANSVKLSPEIEKALSGSEVKSTSNDFGSMLNDKLKEVDELQKKSDTAATDFATGKSRNLHETVLAMEMADTSLRMLVTVRNKALEAYQEIMRMPI